MSLLKTSNNALIELDLFGNEGLECLLEMRISFALEVGQLRQHRIGDDISASVHILQLGGTHLILGSDTLAILALLYGAFVPGKDIRKAVQDASANG